MVLCAAIFSVGVDSVGQKKRHKFCAKRARVVFNRFIMSYFYPAGAATASIKNTVEDKFPLQCRFFWMCKLLSGDG